MNKLKLQILTLAIAMIASCPLQLFSQCGPGPFTVDPASAEELDCFIEVPFVSSACDNLEQATVRDEFNFTIPSGAQFCFILPVSASFRFSTCNLTTDDTSITVFDELSNPIDLQESICAQPYTQAQSSISFDGIQGTLLCIQIESVDQQGVCEGLNSASPSYELSVTCFSPVVDNFEPTFTEPNLCQTTGFNELQTLTRETGLFDRVPVNFNTGTMSPENIQYSSGSLTICVQGDLGTISEIWQIRDENDVCLGGLGNFRDTDIGFGDNGCTDTPACTSFNFSASDISAYIADGVVTFRAFEFGEIGVFCESNFVSMELTLCTDNIIPTMGEWGLMCLGIVLLTFGVVAIRQKQVVLH